MPQQSKTQQLAAVIALVTLYGVALTAIALAAIIYG